jgi:hypothetical protein
MTNGTLCFFAVRVLGRIFVPPSIR